MDKIELIIDDITVEEYLMLRKKVGWRKLSDTQARLAIDRSLYFVKAVDGKGNIVGMGRIVGDGAVICYIQDLVVAPEAQGRGVGSMIINELMQYVNQIKEAGTTMMLCLMCAKGREEFYLKHGFTSRPNDNLGPGMIKFLQSEGDL